MSVDAAADFAEGVAFLLLNVLLAARAAAAELSLVVFLWVDTKLRRLLPICFQIENRIEPQKGKAPDFRKEIRGLFGCGNRI